MTPEEALGLFSTEEVSLALYVLKSTGTGINKTI
jgi:hypothetical protein